MAPLRLKLEYLDLIADYLGIERSPQSIEQFVRASIVRGRSSGMTWVQIADRLGVNEKTARNWHQRLEL